MTLVHKRLGNVVTSPANGASTTIYTVPTGKTAIIKELVMSSDNASASDVTVSINGLFYIRKTLPAGAYLNFPLSTVLAATDVLSVSQTVGASTYFQASGWEFDTPTSGSIPMRFKANPAGGASGTVYTVPTGKRFVIKEMLFAHNTTTSVSVYVPSVINLFKGTMAGGDTLMASVDTVLEAGQALTYSPGAYTADITVSGLLEDV